ICGTFQQLIGIDVQQISMSNIQISLCLDFTLKCHTFMHPFSPVQEWSQDGLCHYSTLFHMYLGILCTSVLHVLGLYVVLLFLHDISIWFWLLVGIFKIYNKLWTTTSIIG
ncbi:hypothetical protein ACJX0J_007195, partial [Zea mays]